MKTNTLHLPLLLLTTLLACQKIDLKPDEGEPVFRVSAKLNGQQRVWEAGVDGYYLFTGFTKDTSDFYVFHGSFRKDSCSGTVCPETLTFYLRDVQAATTNLPVPSQSFLIGAHPLAGAGGIDTVWVVDSATILQLALDASPSVVAQGANANYTWTLSDFSQFNGKSVLVSLANQVGDLSVELTMTSAIGNCSSSQVQAIISMSPLSPPACEVWLDTLISPGSTFPSAMKASATGIAPFFWEWSTGDSSQTIPLGNLNPAVPLAVTLTDSAGCKASAAGQVPGQQSQFCSARFNWALNQATVLDSVPVLVNQPLAPGSVTVVYTGANGEVYSSAYGPQASAGDAFEILAMEDFDNNEKGEKTKKLTVKFQCTLFSANGNLITLHQGEGVIAVAHP